MGQSKVALLDRDLLRMRRARAALRLDEYRFLLDITGENLLSRLDDITRDFPIALQIGARDGGVFSDGIRTRGGAEHVFRMDLERSLLGGASGSDLCADEEILPFCHGALDLVISNLSLHSVNDLPGALIQARMALRKDGLFLASMFGGETLHELRASMMHGEMAVSGGARPRVMPFADKPQMGALLHRAGFALPVVDSDIITVTYGSLKALMHDLRGMGEASIIADQPRGGTSRAVFEAAEAYYAANFADSDGRLQASFEVIYLIGWAPHESQQQPLKPGSADVRLADALNTQEKPL